MYSMMLYISFPGLESGILHDIPRNTGKNANMSHDIKFDFNKPNDEKKFTSPLNVSQYIFIDSFSICLLEWK